MDNVIKFPVKNGEFTVTSGRQAAGRSRIAEFMARDLSEFSEMPNMVIESPPGMAFAARSIPFNRRFYCVYHNGLADFNATSLYRCLKHIARALRPDGRLGFVTAKEAMDAGFEIRSV